MSFKVCGMDVKLFVAINSNAEPMNVMSEHVRSLNMMGGVSEFF